MVDAALNWTTVPTKVNRPFLIPVEIGSVPRTWLFFTPRNYPLSLEVGEITIIIYASIFTYLKLTIVGSY